MKKLCFILVFTCLALVTGCNGSSGKNTNVDGEQSVVASLQLSTINAENQVQHSFDKQSTITLQAKVLDSKDLPVSNRRIDFETDLGTLSTTSSLTNSEGIAEITISNPELTLSAGTASATIDNLNEIIDYEFINNATTTYTPNLSIKMSISGSVNNQLKADQKAQIVVTLTDKNNQAIANELVSFTADIGQLESTSAMTNADGLASVNLSSDGTIGAGVITASLQQNSAISARMNYAIIAADSVIDDDIRIGYIDENGDFTEGKVATSIPNNTISAGGTLGVHVDLIDSANDRISTPTPVTFTSNCVGSGSATIDETVVSIRGKASATFEDLNCAGVSGTDDVIVASIGDKTNIASQVITIQGEHLGSIEFVSSAPNAIVLKGSGGQETSTLTFVVKSEIGNVIPQQEVEFSLDTTVGGISLSREMGLTNSQGLITTQVASGTTPTVVRVTATATMTSNGSTSPTTVQTQSNELSINTGLPEQSSFTIAASVINPEASTIGEKVTISAWLADSFNNPVPDGTSVNFTTEGGSIESSCNTFGGSCSVEWTSSGALFSDHRSTILATASGHETFFDANGNNTFDSNDGTAVTNAAVSSGFARQSPLASGFVDMSEAWRDDNENLVKDAAEVIFFDDNGDGKFSLADGKFNGPQCSGNLCDSDAKKSTLRKALVLIMSSAEDPSFILSSADEATTYQSSAGANTPLPTVADGSSLTLKFRFADSAMQTLPFGSTVSVVLEGGTLKGTTTYNVGNTGVSGYQAISFRIENETGNDPETGRLTVSIKTPKTQDNIVVNEEFLLP